MASKQNRKPASKAQTKPRPKQRQEKEEASPAELLWRMSLLLCTGLVVVALLFSSIIGGSEYVGVEEQDQAKATPTPPVETADPNVNVQGSDITPVPPSASPEVSE